MRTIRLVVALVARGLAGAIVAGTVAVASYPLWRSWCLTWGSRADEATGALPGDELLPDPDVVSTRAIGIGVPPSAVWPWLIQMGPGRAGAYTYDWIENLAHLEMHSSAEIIPELQHMAVGDSWKLGPKGALLRVATLEDESSLVLRSDDGNWVWAFVLAPDGPGCRLISRNRFRQPGTTALARTAFTYFMEPGSLVMERKMLLGIKQRAEGRRDRGEAAGDQDTAISRHQSGASAQDATDSSNSGS
jgi:hypothetical protein